MNKKRPINSVESEYHSSAYRRKKGNPKPFVVETNFDDLEFARLCELDDVEDLRKNQGPLTEVDQVVSWLDERTKSFFGTEDISEEDKDGQEESLIYDDEQRGARDEEASQSIGVGTMKSAWYRSGRSNFVNTSEYLSPLDVYDPEPKKCFVPGYNINNVVFTLRIVPVDRPLPLKKLSELLTLFEYNPRVFAAMKIRFTDPRCTMLIFKSGKIVGTGVHSVDGAIFASRLIVNIFREKFGIPAEILEFKIQNIVATTYCCRPNEDEILALVLENIFSENPVASSYEDELFPGLVYRMDKPKVVFLIFRSGRIVITGVKCIPQLIEAWEKCYYEVCLPHGVDADFINTSSNYSFSQRRDTLTVCNVGSSYNELGGKRTTSKQDDQNKEGEDDSLIYTGNIVTDIVSNLQMLCYNGNGSKASSRKKKKKPPAPKQKKD